MRKKTWKRLREGWRRMLPCLRSSWRRTIITLLKHWECKNTEGTTCVLFHSGAQGFAAWPPCRVLAELSEFLRVTVLVALSSQTSNKREEGEQYPGNTLIAVLIWWQQGSCWWLHHSHSSHKTLYWRLRPLPNPSQSPQKANAALWPITGIICRAANDAQPD